MAARFCKRGHPMKQVGRGDKKRWVCNKCRAAARRASSTGRRGRRISLSLSWSPEMQPVASAPAVNVSYYDRPGEEEAQ